MSFEATLREALVHEDKLSKLIQTIMSGGARLEYIYSDSPQLHLNLSEIFEQNQLPVPILSIFLHQWRQNLEQECEYAKAKGHFAACLYGERLLFILDTFFLKLQEISRSGGTHIPTSEQPVVNKIESPSTAAELVKVSETFIKQSTYEVLILRYPKLKQMGFSFDRLLDLAPKIHAELAITDLDNNSEQLLKLGYSIENLLNIAKFNSSVLAYLVTNTENLLNYYQISQIAMIATLPNAVSILEKRRAQHSIAKNSQSFFSSAQTAQALIEIEQSIYPVSRKGTLDTAIELIELKKLLPVSIDWYVNPLRDCYIWIAPHNYDFIRYKKILEVISRINKLSNFLEQYEYDDKSLTLSIPKSLWSAFYPYAGPPQHTLKQEDLILCTQTAENYVRFIPDRAILVCNSRLNALINANHLKYLWEYYKENKPSTEVITVSEKWITIHEWYKFERLLFPQQQPQIVINLTHYIHWENHHHQHGMLPNTLNITQDATNTQDSFNITNTQPQPF